MMTRMLQIGINAITYAAGYLSKPSRNINVVLAKKVLSIPIMTAVLSSSATLKAINKKHLVDLQCQMTNSLHMLPKLNPNYSNFPEVMRCK